MRKLSSKTNIIFIRTDLTVSFFLLRNLKKEFFRVRVAANELQCVPKNIPILLHPIKIRITCMVNDAYLCFHLSSLLTNHTMFSWFFCTEERNYFWIHLLQADCNTNSDCKANQCCVSRSDFLIVSKRESGMIWKSQLLNLIAPILLLFCSIYALLWVWLQYLVFN